MWLSPERRPHLLRNIARVSRVLVGCQGATVTLFRSVEVSGVAFWHGSGSSRRSSYVDALVEVSRT
eukprot:752874-Pyramimonas_sp.AAC.1